MKWKLKRVRQCEKCPWKVSTDPNEIPDGYSKEAHKALSKTIAEPGALRFGDMHIMSCHEHDSSEGVHCIGWLVNQLGPGNNIPLRLQMMSCENARNIHLDGDQHERFEDTLPD